MDSNTVSIPVTAPLNRVSGGESKHACQAECKVMLDYNEVCSSYEAALCPMHPKWDEVLLHEKPNYIWLRVNDYHNGWENTEAGADIWSSSYDYTFKFFTEHGCHEPMLDNFATPLQFTIDTAWENDVNVLKVVRYLLDAKMPVKGYWRGSRKERVDSVEQGHHIAHPEGPRAICEDPAHCTPPPLGPGGRL
ncbi:hypothetical protein TWF718_009112 [Orbilia javanica]|uniref:Uncharacterized protein n=1 Tax=Orbilia javanica TaxID=47235 RepID=A0AAN8MLR0_9PEZI